MNKTISNKMNKKDKTFKSSYTWKTKSISWFFLFIFSFRFLAVDAHGLEILDDYLAQSEQEKRLHDELKKTVAQFLTSELIPVTKELANTVQATERSKYLETFTLLHSDYRKVKYALLDNISETRSAIEQAAEEDKEQLQAILTLQESALSQVRHLDAHAANLGQDQNAHNNAVQSINEITATFEQEAAQLPSSASSTQSSDSSSETVIDFANLSKIDPVLFEAVESYLRSSSLAAGEPVAADLAINAPLTSASQVVVDLAEELQTPAKVFAYFRNNFVYQPYFGAVKGADKTLADMAGSDADIALALASVLRTLGVPTRFIYGTIHLTPSEAANWLAVSENHVADTFAAAQIPFRQKEDGSFQVDHVWLSAYIDYLPYRGTTPVPSIQDGTLTSVGDSWIEIDPSFKKHGYSERRNIPAELGLNTETFLTNTSLQYTRDALTQPNLANTDSTVDKVSNTPEALIVNEVVSLGNRLVDFMNQNNLPTSQIFRERVILEENFNLLPCTDYYKVHARGPRFSKFPQALAAKVALSLKGAQAQELIQWTSLTAGLSEKSISLDYKVASAEDQALINSWEGDDAKDIVNLNLFPVVKVNGQEEVLSVETVATGENLSADWTFLAPANDPAIFPEIQPELNAIISDKISAGATQEFVFSDGAVSEATLVQTAESLEQGKRLNTYLRSIGLNAFYQADRFASLSASALNLQAQRLPSLYRVTADLDVNQLFNRPFTADTGSVKVQILRDAFAVNKAGVSSVNRPVETFKLIQNLTNSVLLSNSLEQMTSAQALSGTRLLQVAAKELKAVYTWKPQLDDNGDNLITYEATIFDNSDIILSAKTKDLILKSLNSAQTVTFARSAITRNGLSREALFISKPETGDASFILLNSAQTTANINGAEIPWETKLPLKDLITQGINLQVTDKLSSTAQGWLQGLDKAIDTLGVAYLPAVLHIANFLNSDQVTSLDQSSIKTVNSIVSLFGRIDSISAQPAILDVTATNRLFSPNADGLKDTFDFSAETPRSSGWVFTITGADAQEKLRLNQANNISPDTNLPEKVNISWDGRDANNTLLADGRYNFSLIATGNGSASYSHTVTIDSTAPTAALSLSTRKVNERDVVTFTGTADDANFESSKIELLNPATNEAVATAFESSAPTVNSAFSIFDTVTVANGDYKVRLTVNDRAGNVTTVLLSDTLNINNPPPDETKPELTVKSDIYTYPEEILSGYINVEATAFDERGIALIEIIVDDKILANSATSPLKATIDASQINEGEHTIVVRALDKTGNETKLAPTKFITSKTPIDRIAPGLSISVSTLSLATDQNMNVTVKAIDNDKVESIQIFIDGQLAASSPVNPNPAELIKTFAGSTFKAGLHSIFARAIDASGNKTDTKSFVFSVTAPADTTAPEVAISTTGTNPLAGSVLFTATASDDTALSKIEILVDDTVVDSVTNPTSNTFSTLIDVSQLEEKEHKFIARATDLAGNSSTSTLTLTTSKTALPQIPVTLEFSGKEGEVLTGKIPVKAFALGELALDKLELVLDGSVIATNSGSSTRSIDTLIDMSAINEGEHTLKARATATNSQVSESAEITFTSSKTAPDTLKPWLTATINNQVFANQEGEQTYRYPENWSGDMNLSLSAVDNVAIDELKMSLNSKTLRILKDSANTPIKGETLNHLIDTADLEDGVYTLSFQATDKTGNTSAFHFAFTLLKDLENPTVSLTTDIKDFSKHKGDVAVQVKATDNKAIAQIQLLLDGTVIKSLTSPDPSELNFIVRADSLIDGTHKLKATTVDASGNAAETAELSFTSYNPVSNWQVSPSLIEEYTSTKTVSISATLQQNWKWNLTFTGGPTAIEAISGEGTSISEAIDARTLEDGNYTVTLSVDGISETWTAPFIVNLVTGPPEAFISNLTDNQVIKEGIYEIKGLAFDPDDEDVVSYQVLLYNADGTVAQNITPKPWNEHGFFEGEVETLGTVAKLDTTLLDNGQYSVTLQTKGGTAQMTTPAIPFSLDSQLKVGQFAFSQQDMVLPVAGLPLGVVRTYNSLNKEIGDFGLSWKYSIADAKLEFNEKRFKSYSLDSAANYEISVRSGGDRTVTVELPDGERYTFYEYYVYGFFGLKGAIQWRPAPGNNASLTAIGRTSFVTINSLQYWEATGPGVPMDAYEFAGYNLTLQDGTRYRIEREKLGNHLVQDPFTYEAYNIDVYGDASLKQITDRNGNYISIDDSKIQHYNALGEKTKAIVFTRNTDNLITEVHTPESLDADGNVIGDPNFKYDYDDQKRLVKVHQLVDRDLSKYRIIEYAYELEAFPNYITAIKDPRGITPMRSEYDDEGRLIATIDAEGNRIELDHNLSARTETIYDRQGNPTLHLYDARGNVTKTIDAQGNTTSRTYDSNDNETSVTDALGNTTYYTYDAKSNQTSMTDALGNVTNYTYDAKGNQTSVTDALGNVTRNTYDSAGNLLSTTDALGRSSSNSYSSGKLTAITDASGNQTASFGYSGDNMTSMVDALGVTRSFSYDSRGNQTGTSFNWVNPLDANDVRSLTTQTVYDSAQQVISSVDALGNMSSNVYNLAGQQIESTDALGNTTKQTYDRRGQVIQVENADGTISRTVYDENGRGYLTTDRYLPDTEPRGSRTVYDSLGRVIRTERLDKVIIDIVDKHDGQVSEIAELGTVISSSSSVYDQAGRMLESIAPDGSRTRYEYDVVGRQTAVIDALDNRTEFEYDKAGRRVLSRDALGRETRFVYDALGRQVETIFADGSKVRQGYDELGRRVSETDQTGKTKNFEYDVAGRLVAVVLAEVLDPETNTRVRPRYEYSYDNYGRLRSIKDPKLRSTEFAYDQFGRQVSRTLPNGNTEYRTYNSLGQLHTMIDFKGQVMEYVYDSLGRQEKKHYYSSESDFDSKVIAQTVSMTYDSLGRVVKMTEARGETSYVYDIEGRLLSMTSPEGTISYAFDERTGRKLKTYTANSDQRYSYDELGRLKTVSAFKQQGQSLSSPLTYTYSYNKVGARDSMTHSNGVKTSYSYNQLNRLTSLIHKQASGDLLASYSYDLRADGRRTGVTEQRRETDNSLSNTSITYTYDELNRLTEEMSSSDKIGEANYMTTYSYGLTGNRLKKENNGNVITYSYNEADQLLEEHSSVDGLTTYEYDVTGAMTRKFNSTKNEDVSYSYNFDNRLSSATIKRIESGQFVNATSTYTYNQNGTRVRARNNYSVDDGSSADEDHVFLVDEGNFTGYAQTLEERKNNALETTYVIGDDVLSQNKLGTVSDLLYDGHGSTRAVTSSNGDIQEAYGYDAYGMMLGGNPSLTNRKQTNLLYSGEQYDNGLQQQYLRARYYDQNNGTFNRLDPFKGKGRDPQSFNKYTYVHGDPVSNIDPSGLLSVASVTSAVSNMIRISANIGIRAFQIYDRVDRALTAFSMLKNLLLITTQPESFGLLQAIKDMRNSVTNNRSGFAGILENPRGFFEASLSSLTAHRNYRRILRNIVRPEKMRRIQGVLSGARGRGFPQIVLQLPLPTQGSIPTRFIPTGISLPLGRYRMNVTLQVGGSRNHGGRAFGIAIRGKNTRDPLNSVYSLFRQDWHTLNAGHTSPNSNEWDLWAGTVTNDRYNFHYHVQK